MKKRLGQSMGPGPLSNKAALGETPASEETHYRALLKSVGIEDADAKKGHFEWLSTHVLVPGPQQPRMQPDEDNLYDLAESIRSSGVIQPLVVKPLGGGKYEIIAGERRWRASQLVEVDEVPCIIRTDLNSAQSLIVSLVENIQRENLNPVEEAMAMRTLVEEFGLSHLEAANAVGRSRPTVTNLLRLLVLDSVVLEHLQAGRIDMGHARAVTSLSPEKQRTLIQQAVNEKWSVRKIERAVQQEKGKTEPVQTPSHDKPAQAELDECIHTFLEKTGEPVSLQIKTNGQVQVTFQSLDQVKKCLE